MGAEDDGPSVNYSVKELLTRIEGKVDVVVGKLDGKLDRSEFVRWTAQHEETDAGHERRITELETAESQRVGVSTSRAKTWIAAGSVGAIATAVAGIVAILIH